MTINFSIPKTPELKPRIVVIGVGGAGGNAVNNMINSGLDGVEFLVANTDAQALALSKADRRIQMGGAITQGLGAGMRPEVGAEAAESSLEEIMGHLEGAHMLFVAAGMGGGTGTGAAPVIAKAARDRGILTVAIVTKPFQFEGSRRMKLADAGIDTLYNSVDTLIVIPNQNLFRVATENTTMADAFALADEVLNSGVRGVTDLMVVPGLINLDFADVRTVMDEMGKAMMGTGEATGERRAIEAAEDAIANPLLDDISLKGAKGVLINITGGSDLTLFEVDEAAEHIRKQVDPEANIIVGSALDNDLDGIVRISVVATGVQSGEIYVPIVDKYLPEAEHAPETASPTQDPIFETSAFGERAQTLQNNSANEIPSLEELELDTPIAPDLGYTRPSNSKQYEYKRPEAPAIQEPVATTTAPAQQVQAAPAPIQPQTQAPAPVQAPALPRVETQTVVKRPFGFFGKKKSKPVPAPTPRPQAQSLTGDLFGAGDDVDMQIPSFLRQK